MLQRYRFVLVALALVGLGSAGIASPASAATTISGAASPLKIDLGQVATLSGRVSTGATGTKLAIERGRNGGWYPYGTATTRAGAWSLRVKPTSSGRYAFRVRAGSVTSPTFYLSVYKLTYLDTYAHPTNGWNEAAISINGKVYGRSGYEVNNFSGSINKVDFDLARKGRRLAMVVGLRDDADSRHRVVWQVFGDGRLLASGQTQLGQSTKVDVDVSNVLRLEFQTQCVKGSCYSGPVGFGDPIIRS